jgi:hypothetical protein
VFGREEEREAGLEEGAEGDPGAELEHVFDEELGWGGVSKLEECEGTVVAGGLPFD